MTQRLMKSFHNERSGLETDQAEQLDALLNQAAKALNKHLETE